MKLGQSGLTMHDRWVSRTRRCAFPYARWGLGPAIAGESETASVLPCKALRVSDPSPVSWARW